MNYNKDNNKKPEPSNSGGLATIVITIIVLLFIILLIWGIMRYLEDRTQRILDKGCEPKAWGSLGVPSIWSCPKGVTLD